MGMESCWKKDGSKEDRSAAPEDMTREQCGHPADAAGIVPDGLKLAYGQLTKEQFNAEIQKGLDDIENGKVYSADEVEAMMNRDFGI